MEGDEEVGGGSGSAQFRVVRCPKCDKLLPELPNFSVYLCGGCGATLQAKKLNQAPDSCSENSSSSSASSGGGGGGNVKYLELVDPEPAKKTSSPLRTDLDKPNRTPDQPPAASRSGAAISPAGTSKPDLNTTKYRRAPKSGTAASARPNSNKEIAYPGMSEQNPNSRIENLEQDRAALLKMLEEIRDQVKRSCEIVGQQQKPAARANPDPSARPGSGYAAGLPGYYPHGHGHGHGHGWRTQNPNPDYFYPQYEPDPLVSYHHEGFYHQPSCACLHCYRDIPVPVQPVHRAVPAIPALPYHHTYHAYQSPNLRESRGGRKVVRPKRSRPCQPVAGASPFVICYNCYELLQVPKRSPVGDKRKVQMKLRCGSCSHAMLLTINGNEITVSVRHENENEINNADYASDFPILKYSFSSKNNDNGNGNSSTSSRGTESETEPVSRVPSLQLHEHLTNNGNSFGEKEKGNVSARSEQEKAVLFAENFKQNSIKDVAVISVPTEMETEMDFSPDEYPQQGLSQDSDAGHEEIGTVGSGGNGGNGGKGDSFFANIFKKGRGNGGRLRVSVNGYVLTDRVVKKAEKRAGPISSGDYWYDYRAGFWGVMGNHCLGMIPPYIEEFNYPLPKNCAGGNTGVAINGRELHRKDLELLAIRGLPRTPGMAYRVEVSGKVWDEFTGEELYNLGKLAPTVEKMRKGFGMRVPRVAS